MCFKSEGLCYQCGKSGHMARQCPDGKNVPSERNNKPPGFSSSNVNFENLCGLADTTKDLHELKVGMMRWLINDKSASDEFDSEDDCPDLQTVSASSESDSSDDDSSTWPDEDDSSIKEDKDSSDWETVLSSENFSESSQHECYSLDWCETNPGEVDEGIQHQIPYQVLFNPGLTGWKLKTSCWPCGMRRKGASWREFPQWIGPPRVTGSLVRRCDHHLNLR